MDGWHSTTYPSDQITLFSAYDCTDCFFWHAVFDKEGPQPLTHSEALFLLQALQQARKDNDPNYVPAPMVQQTKQYLERFSTVKSEAGGNALRE